MTAAEILGEPTCPPAIGVEETFAPTAGLDRMGAVKASTRRRAFEICEWLAGQGRPLFVLWGKVSNSRNVEHYGGYGVDFMTFSNAALTQHDRTRGDKIVEYVLTNRARLKVRGMIWRQRRIGYSSGWSSWVNMPDRGSPTANHYDHVHILFEAATYVPLPAPNLPTYTVQRGDSLSSIASRIGVPWQTIAALNPGLDPNRIRVGQVIIVPKKVPPKPKPEPDPVTKPDPITLRLKAWDGSPAGRTLIQGVLCDETNDCYFVHQADDVAGQGEQDVVIRRHKADGTYVGWATIVGAGHGSSVGLDPFDGGARLWLGHATLGASGFMAYNIGDADTPFTKTPAIPKGDISIDAAADLLCVRVSTRFRGYKLSDARKNKATKVFDVKIANWLVRFQGHLITADRIFIHRDAKTKGASELRSYDFTGKLLKKWDTSGWGDEAEGAMVKKGWVYSVSRVGGDTPNRTILCTPVERY